MPERVVFSPAALAEPWGRQIAERVTNLGLPVEELPANRLTGLRGQDERATYRTAKRTLTVVNAPAGMLRLQPIPPSADWQFHLATGCPAHCQYCYLAGSLQGPPVVRVFANLPAILDATRSYVQTELLERAAAALDVPCDLTVELITHRFTPTSKRVLRGWYPNSSLEMDEATRSLKRGKHGALKYVYAASTMRELRAFFERELARRLPQVRTLYWT